MCLITKNNPQIAEGDIKVKKLVCLPNVAGVGKNEADYVSWFMGFPYKRGVVYYTEIASSNDLSAFDARSRIYYERQGKVLSYSIGFHSIKPNRRGDDGGYGNGAIKADAIIPAGATYITDNTGLYISNSIIIL